MSSMLKSFAHAQKHRIFTICGDDKRMDYARALRSSAKRNWALGTRLVQTPQTKYSRNSGGVVSIYMGGGGGARFVNILP